MDYLILLMGFVLLVKGADLFVTGSSSIATMLRIPPLVVGLTIVAFGTSAPEAAVSITAALQGQSDITMGNIVGSNMFNLLVVVGIAACILPFTVKRTIIAKEFPFVILTCVVLLILSFDVVLVNGTVNSLDRTDGLILLVFFAVFMYYLLSVAIKSSKENKDKEVFVALSTSKSVIYLVIGMAGIIFGGQLAVNAATEIALAWGMSETLVGLTIIAVGTSLPELMTSVVAAKKGESDIALGNVIGSNIFNVFFILGLSAVITPIGISSAVLCDSLILLAISLVAFVFAVTNLKFSKGEGLTMIFLYVVYMVFIIIRN